MTALSENVLSVLKSFSSINQSIVIKPGDKLRDDLKSKDYHGRG